LKKELIEEKTKFRYVEPLVINADEIKDGVTYYLAP
jgi:hypothetical protein